MTDKSAIPATFEERPLRVSDLVRSVMRQKWFFALIFAIVMLLAIAAAFLLPKTYQASTLVADASEQADSGQLAALAGQFGGLASLAGVNLDSGGSKEKAVAILLSRSFTQEFIRDEGLMPVLYSDLWDPDSQSWSVESDEEVPTLWQAVKYFDREVRNVGVRRDDGLVVLSITWRDPEIAAQWANRLIERVNQKIRAESIAEARKSIAYLEEQLQQTSAIELQQGIYRLIENNLNKIMLANVRDEYAFKVLDAAFPPDKNDFESPKRLLILAAGLLFGLFTATAASLLRDARRNRQT